MIISIFSERLSGGLRLSQATHKEYLHCADRSQSPSPSHHYIRTHPSKRHRLRAVPLTNHVRNPQKYKRPLMKESFRRDKHIHLLPKYLPCVRNRESVRCIQNLDWVYFFGINFLRRLIKRAGTFAIVPTIIASGDDDIDFFVEVLADVTGEDSTRGGRN